MYSTETSLENLHLHFLVFFMQELFTAKRIPNFLIFFFPKQTMD